MSATIHVTDETFEAEVLKASLPTIVDFWAEWCMPCKRIAPILEEIAAEYDGKLRVAKMDVDSSPSTPQQLGLSSIPALLLYRDGELVESIIGFHPKDRLLAKVMPHLG
jgi:thioredoxin 1